MPSDDERSTLLGSTPTENTQKREQKKTARTTRKATRFASRTQQLESVSETEEQAEAVSSPSARQEFFGVRSYVHTFYEAMAMEEPGRRLKKGGRVCRRRLWRCAYATGALLLISGLCVLLVGHLVAKRREVVDVQEDIEVVSRAGQAFNRKLDACKIAGLGLFCAGGALTTCALVALVFCDQRPDEKEEDVSSMADPEPGPQPLAVPVTEEVRAVQPGRTDTEVNMSCTCKGRT